MKRLSDLEIPGTPEFVSAARRILEIKFALSPEYAAEAGLFEDAGNVPSFSEQSVNQVLERLESVMKEMRAMPWRDWDIERRIDFRWMFAMGETLHYRLAVEKRFSHRPAEWLEAAAGMLLALTTYVPERGDLRIQIFRQFPSMVSEMREVLKEPTRQDVEIADGMLEGLFAILDGEPQDKTIRAARQALEELSSWMRELENLPEYRVVGEEAYAWRLRRSLLLPWSPDELLESAEAESKKVEAALETLAPLRRRAPRATADQIEQARDLDCESFLALYDRMLEEQRAFLTRADLASVPNEVGPIRARETPKALIPLTGDGGSMNPPPPFVESNVGFWNVENFKSDWSQARRERFVVGIQNYKETDLGPYAVHEGVPGHHLQLSIARLNPNPLRSIVFDSPMAEGWALYAEEIFRAAGGFDAKPLGDLQTLDSWLFRIRRVIYDVRIETGQWSLQEGADWKHRAPAGKGKLDPDLLRTVNWPAQLIGYFAGRMQILEMKEALRKKQGSAFSEKGFHDALLEVGSLPLALARAKLLDEDVPGID